MFFFSKYCKFSTGFQIFSFSIATASSLFLSTMTHASSKNEAPDLSVAPSSENVQASKKIQTEAYDYQHQIASNASVNSIEIKNPVLRQNSDNLIEGSFSLQNKATKDFLLQGITSEKCKTVGQFQDGQASVESTEDASGNIFKNLPIAHLNTIAFPFSSFHLACVPKNDSFEEGTQIPFVFHFKEGNKTYNFTVKNNAK